MSEHVPHSENRAVTSVKRHQFITIVASAILISLFLVYVALSLYRSSGALQLDLSRPGYDNARKEASKDKQIFKGFSSEGEINQKSLDEFSEMYRQKGIEALSVDAFSGTALSDETLMLQ